MGHGDDAESFRRPVTVTPQNQAVSRRAAARLASRRQDCDDDPRVETRFRFHSKTLADKRLSRAAVRSPLIGHRKRQGSIGSRIGNELLRGNPRAWIGGRSHRNNRARFRNPGYLPKCDVCTLILTDRDICRAFVCGFLQPGFENAVLIGLYDPVAPKRFVGAGDREENYGDRQYSEHGDSESSLARTEAQAP